MWRNGDIMQDIFDLIDEDELVDIFSKAVNIPSINPTGNEKPMCEYVESLLRQNDIDYFTVPVEKDRYDIIAKIKGKSDKDAVVFTGHMDVVPVSDDEMKRWNTPPFKATIKDGKLFGRGSADMKSGLISAIYSMILLKRHNITPSRDVILAATIDEENYMKGSKALQDHPIFENAKYLIVCEPTDMKICNEQKGRTWADVCVYGMTAHGSQKGVGENAIYLAIKLVEKIKNSEFENYPDTFWRTLAINAGVEPQVVPDRCVFTVDARLQVGHPPVQIWERLQEMIQEMKSENPHFDASYEIADMRTSWHTSKKDKLIQSIEKSLRTIGIKPVFETFSGSTDASMLIKNKLIPVIIGPGDLSVVHRENEYVNLSQLYDSCKLYMDIMTSI
jgi:peptidase, argE/dapE family